MKKLGIAVLLIVALALPGVSLSQVETSMGAIQLGGKIKWVYAYMPEDENAVGAGTTGQLWGFDGQGVEQFATTNVEIDLAGKVGEKVAYLIEIQAANGTAGWASNPNEMGPIGVRQAKMVFTDVVPMTTITVGTFNLPVTIYQPRATNDFDLIMLPLLNTARVIGGAYPGAIYGTYSPIGLGWQATGVNLAISPVDALELDVAYFNGYAGANPNVDLDLEKSGLATLKIKPGNFMASVSYMWEGWQEPTTGGHHSADGWIGSISFLQERFELNGDFVYMTAKDYQLDDKGSRTDLSWMSYQVTAGYWLTDDLEILGRYEWIDPNTINDADAGGVTDGGLVTENDQLTWITAGINYRLNECSEVSANYVFRSEQGSDIDVDALDPVTLLPEVGGKYQSLNNDLLLIQVQVWQ